jgi:hypothetical protein
MPTPTPPAVREALLAELNTRPKFGGNPTQESVLQAAAKRLGIPSGDTEREQALLTQWSELFRTGLVAWGNNLSNPGPPFFHQTESGRRALAHLTRDPSNPAGYLRHLNAVAALDPVTTSYITEALDCYVGGFYKAAAVMTGAAAESIVLNLRDVTVQKLASLPRAIPNGMTAWKLKTITDTMHHFLDGCKGKFPQTLREEFDARWSALTQQIRATRNVAGHPTTIDPVTYDDVHAGLLIFPELAKLAKNLNLWVTNQLT